MKRVEPSSSAGLLSFDYRRVCETSAVCLVGGNVWVKRVETTYAIHRTCCWSSVLNKFVVGDDTRDRQQRTTPTMDESADNNVGFYTLCILQADRRAEQLGLSLTTSALLIKVAVVLYVAETTTDDTVVG
jgi:hypothetical protein